MIRQEIRSIEHYDPNSLDSLPILDSFIKEAVRVNPLDKSKSSAKACVPRGRTDSICSGHQTESDAAVYLLQRRATCVNW